MPDSVKPTVDDSVKGSRGGPTKADGIGKGEQHSDLIISQAIGSCLSSPRRTIQELGIAKLKEGMGMKSRDEQKQDEDKKVEADKKKKKEAGSAGNEGKGNPNHDSDGKFT